MEEPILNAHNKAEYEPAHTASKVFGFLLIVTASLLAVISCQLAVYDWQSDRKVTEVYRQDFPDGVHTLVISHVGEPIFPYGEDRMKVSILEGRKAVYDTLVLVRNDGARGRFTVEWLDGRPIVTLSGDEMEDITLNL